MTTGDGLPEVSYTVRTTDQHTAAAFGNTGVHVIGTPALIGFLETASADCAKPLIGEGDATVGTMVAVRHLAPRRSMRSSKHARVSWAATNEG